MAKHDATVLLDEDHHEVEQMFQQYKAAREDSRKRILAQQICDELAVHMKVEEEIFYPAFQRATGNGEEAAHGVHEHQEARELMAKIRKAPQPDDKVMLELEDAILHHVNDEREKMFPQARKAKNLDLMQLADQLEERKAELKAAQPA